MMMLQSMHVQATIALQLQAALAQPCQYFAKLLPNPNLFLGACYFCLSLFLCS
jgi:hypothetical protein